MQFVVPCKITPSTAIQMQTQLSNLIAIQNLQEYLKYLILTTSIEPQAMKAPEKIADDMTQQSTPQKQDSTNIMMVEEKQEICTEEKTPTLGSEIHKSLKNTLSTRDLKRKKSQKLFSLMLKKCYIPKTSNSQEETSERTNEIQDKLSVIPLLKRSFKEKNVVCGHPWRDHYAKGLCSCCYLKFGRTKKPWNCNHEKLYALGLCQKCYAAKYNMKKKQVEPETCNNGEQQITKSTMEVEKIRTEAKESEPVVKIETIV